MESKTLTAGEAPTIVDTGNGSSKPLNFKWKFKIYRHGYLSDF